MSRIAFSVMAVLVVVGCSGREGPDPVSPEASPSATTVRPGIAASLSEASRRGGALHVTKECSAYTGLAGSFCTLTSSNVKEIKVGSKVVYASAAGATSLDSDVILDPPGHGKSTAFGHCHLEFATGLGLCTFHGGTGKFKKFHASVDVSHLAGPNWAWDGVYGFGPHD